MTFKMIRTSIRPSADIRFYRLTDKLLEAYANRYGKTLSEAKNQLEAAFEALGDRYLGTTIEETSNTQIVTRLFVDEAAYREAKAEIDIDPDVETIRLDREQYNSDNGITTNVVTLTV